MTRPATFRGRTMTSGAFNLHDVIRITPTLHEVGSPPPTPPAGYVVPIDTPMGLVNAEVLTSRPDGMLMEVRGAKLGFSPARPAEGQGFDGDAGDGGATDWVIRIMG